MGKSKKNILLIVIRGHLSGHLTDEKAAATNIVFMKKGADVSN
jgi:hypothetical protein